MSKEEPVMFQDVKAKGLLKHIIIGIVVAVFSGGHDLLRGVRVAWHRGWDGLSRKFSSSTHTLIV